MAWLTRVQKTVFVIFHLAEMRGKPHSGRMRSIAILAVSVGGLGFVLMIGYAVKTLFRDFGPAAGLAGSFCTIIGFVALGFLLDTRQPPGPR